MNYGGTARRGRRNQLRGEGQEKSRGIIREHETKGDNGQRDPRQDKLIDIACLRINACSRDSSSTMDVVYRDDPPFDSWLQLVRSAYASDLWCLAETDFYLLKKAFGRRFRMLVAYDQLGHFPIGCICSTTYNHRDRLQLSTVLGLFYVRAEFRGQGIGNELFRRIIHGKQQQNLFLNGSRPARNTRNKRRLVSYMVEKYKLSYGFVVENSWKAVWYQVSPSKVDLSKLKMACSVVGLTKENLAKVVEYDKKYQDDLDRTEFISRFVSQECSDTQIAVDETSRVIGYGTARLLINSELCIGPLYANSPRIAISLLLSLLTGKFKDSYKNLQLQIPSSNEDSKWMMEELSNGHCTKEDYTLGLATKFRLKTEINRVYSTTEYDFSFV